MSQYDVNFVCCVDKEKKQKSSVIRTFSSQNKLHQLTTTNEHSNNIMLRCTQKVKYITVQRMLTSSMEERRCESEVEEEDISTKTRLLMN